MRYVAPTIATARPLLTTPTGPPSLMGVGMVNILQPQHPPLGSGSGRDPPPPPHPRLGKILGFLMVLAKNLKKPQKSGFRGGLKKGQKTTFFRPPKRGLIRRGGAMFL